MDHPFEDPSPEEGIGYPLQYSWVSLVAQTVKNLPAIRETWVQSLGWEDPPGGGQWQPTRVFLPRESPRTEESGRLQSMGSQRVGHNWVTKHTQPWAGQSVSSVAQLCPTLRPHEPQHTRPPCPSPNPGVHSDSHPSSQWCHPAISSILCHPLLLLPSIFPSIRVFSNESVFASGGQNIGVSALVSVLPMNIQDCFHLGLIGWISLQIKGLSRVFSNTTIQKHQFFGAQLSL